MIGYEKYVTRVPEIVSYIVSSGVFSSKILGYIITKICSSFGGGFGVPKNWKTRWKKETKPWLLPYKHQKYAAYYLNVLIRNWAYGVSLCGVHVNSDTAIFRRVKWFLNFLVQLSGPQCETILGHE